MNLSDQTAPPRRRRRAWRIARWTMLGLVALIALCLGAGQIAKARLRSRYPAPGTLVDIGGYRLHINCVGSGGPTVILESGLGEFSPMWANVQPQVAANTRVCAYDRGGYGWSERSPLPPTAESSVAELHALLGAAGIAPPYVLVGHSLGGLYVRLYARRYPAEVAGLVLVDPSHEDQNDTLPPEYKQAMAQIIADSESQMDVIKVLIGSGLLALRPSIIDASDKLPPEARDALNAIMARDSTSLETNLAETKLIDETFAQVRAAAPASAAGSLGAIPLIVLSRGEAALPPPDITLDPAVIARGEAISRAQKAQVAALSTNGREVVVPGSGHHIQLDKPDAVIAAILEVVAAAR